MLEDLQGAIELVIFPGVYQRVEHLLVNDSIVTITGKVDIREDEDPMILVEGIAAFVKEDKSFIGKSLYVRIPKDMGEDKQTLIRILKTSPARKVSVCWLNRQGRDSGRTEK